MLKHFLNRSYGLTIALLSAAFFSFAFGTQALAATVPGLPGSLATTSVATGAVSISWTASANTPTNYIIGKSTVSGVSGYSTSSLGSTSTFATFSGLLPNTKYWFEVAGQNASGTGSFATTSGFTYTLPETLGLTIGTPTTSTIPFTINAGANPANTLYAIGVYRTTTPPSGDLDYILSTSTGEIIPIGLASADVQDYFVVSSSWSSIAATGLTPNTGYSLQTYIPVDGQDGSDSNVSDSSSDVVYTAASTPGSLSVVATSPNQINVSWSGDATDYAVTNLASGAASGVITDTSYIFSGLTCNTAYSFSVTGRNHAGATTSAAVVSATTGACVSGGTFAAPTAPATAASNSVSISSFATAGNTAFLNLSASGAESMALAEDPSFAGASWLDYKPSASFALSTGAGQKTIYVKFRYPNGAETAPVAITVNVSVAAAGSPSGSASIVTALSGTPANSNVSFVLPAALQIKLGQTIKYKYTYTNNSSKTQHITINRLLVKDGKTITRNYGYRTVKAGKSVVVPVVQTLNKKLKSGDYEVVVKIFDNKGKTLDSNNFNLTAK